MKSVVWMLAILPLLYLSPARAQDSPPNLTGKWVLNEKMSDDFAEVMHKARSGGSERPEGGGQGGGPGGGGGGRGGGGSGGRGGGQGGGGGGGGGGGDQGGGGDRQAKDQERMEQASKAYSRLEIFNEGVELNVTNGLDITHLLYTDGREMTIWTEQGEAKATANWEGQTLVVEWKTREDSLSRTRWYTLYEEGRQLAMKESILPPGQDKPIEFNVVYDRNN